MERNSITQEYLYMHQWKFLEKYYDLSDIKFFFSAVIHFFTPCTSLQKPVLHLV